MAWEMGTYSCEKKISTGIDVNLRILIKKKLISLVSRKKIAVHRNGN